MRWGCKLEKERCGDVLDSIQFDVLFARVPTPIQVPDCVVLQEMFVSKEDEKDHVRLIQ